MSKIESVNDLLSELEEKVPDIIGSAVIRTNGLLVASSLQNQDESNIRLISAMAAALLGTSKRTAETLYDGEFQSLNLEINKGNLFLMNAGRVILVATTKKQPNIGLVTLEMEDISEKIGNLFKME
jgi:predicted regulator of Ras-like GTPase activity (Roadblock/LC7/MglB family)